MVSLLEAKGIPYHVKGAYFGGLYAWPPIENYNARTVLIPAESVAMAEETLAGLPGRGHLERRRLSGCERALVVIMYLVSGWPAPCLPSRFRFVRSLLLAVAGASLLMIAALLVFVGGALVGNWWEGMTAGRGVAGRSARPAAASYCVLSEPAGTGRQSLTVSSGMAMAPAGFASLLGAQRLDRIQPRRAVGGEDAARAGRWRATRRSRPR